MKVSKREIATRVSATSSVPLPTIIRIIDKTFLEIEKAIVDGDRVRIVGFGEFCSRFRRGRPVANPQNTSEKIEAKDVYVAKFRVGSHLKNLLKLVK